MPCDTYQYVPGKNKIYKAEFFVCVALYKNPVRVNKMSHIFSVWMIYKQYYAFTFLVKPLSVQLEDRMMMI